jgi:hypothetical protein
VAKVEDSAWPRPDDDARAKTPTAGADAAGPAAAAPSGLSRRDFVRGGSTAMGAGAALVWAGPTIRSIRIAANAGSPMPPTTTGTVFPGGSTIAAPEPSTSVPGSTTATTKPGVPSAASTSSDTLPFTGAAIATTAAAGAGAIVAGRALMAARRRPPER